MISLAGCKMLSPAATAFAEISAKMSREQEVNWVACAYARKRGGALQAVTLYLKEMSRYFALRIVATHRTQQNSLPPGRRSMEHHPIVDMSLLPLPPQFPLQPRSCIEPSKYYRKSARQRR